MIPGTKWKACGGDIVQADAPYDTVATTYDDRKPTEDSPNAKFIAAGPEIAEALIEILKAYPEWDQLSEKARAALAKGGL